MGMLFIIGLFTLLVVKIFLIGKQAQQLGRHFAGLMAYGFGLWIAIQFIVSIGLIPAYCRQKG